MEPPTMCTEWRTARRAMAATDGDADRVASSPTSGQGSAYLPKAAVA